MIRDRKEELLRLHGEHSSSDEVARTNGHRSVESPMSDEEIIGLCRKARNALKFERLFDHGDATETTPVLLPLDRGGITPRGRHAQQAVHTCTITSGQHHLEGGVLRRTPHLLVRPPVLYLRGLLEPVQVRERYACGTVVGEVLEQIGGLGP